MKQIARWLLVLLFWTSSLAMGGYDDFGQSSLAGKTEMALVRVGDRLATVNDVNYGVGYAGIIIDPSMVWGNFVDSFHITIGTSRPSP